MMFKCSSVAKFLLLNLPNITPQTERQLMNCVLNKCWELYIS